MRPLAWRVALLSLLSLPAEAIGVSQGLHFGPLIVDDFYLVRDEKALSFARGWIGKTLHPRPEKVSSFLAVCWGATASSTTSAGRQYAWGQYKWIKIPFMPWMGKTAPSFEYGRPYLKDGPIFTVTPDWGAKLTFGLVAGLGSSASDSGSSSAAECTC